MNKQRLSHLIFSLALLIGLLIPTPGNLPLVRAATGAWVDDDFSDGTFNNTELVSGDLVLVQTQDFFDDFDTGSLDPAKWELNNWLGGVVGLTFASTTVAVTGGDFIRTVPEFQPGYTVEAQVLLSDGGNSHFGFADTIQGGTYGIADPSWAIFSARNGQFLARTRLNSVEQNDVLPGITLGITHTLRIVWNAADVEFWVDGTHQTTHTRALDLPLRVYASSNAGQPITIDWAHVYTPGTYVPSGTYISNVFDAGEHSDFTTLSSSHTTPAGTTIGFETRTSANGTTWSNWQAVDSSGTIASPDNRYVQYCATLGGDGNDTPILQEVTVNYTDDTTPPDPPTSLDADRGNGQVELHWSAVSDPALAGYQVYYGTTQGGPYNGTDATEGASPISVGAVTQFNLTGLSNGTTYFFVVTALDGEGNESAPSNEASATPQAPDPDPPTVVSAGPTGSAEPRDTWIEVTFSESMDPDTFVGSINGAAIVLTQLLWNSDDSAVSIDPGELEYGRNYAVVIRGSTQDVSGNPLQGGDYNFNFTVEDNPNPKRPTTTITLPPGPFEAGQTCTISGQASGYVWERDPDNPLELWHWNQSGSVTGDRPMLHPAALYFPDGLDGYTYWLFYTPYPPGADENPVLVRSNDGEAFTATGVPQNPLFTYNNQPPYDMMNLADPEAYRLGDTWMLFYEMEVQASTAHSIGPWMHGGGYIGVAFSPDGVTWEPDGGPYTYDPGNPPTGFPPNGNPVIYPEDTYWYEDDSNSKTGEIAVFFKDGLYHLWRTVLDSGAVRVAYDTASDPRGPWSKQGVAVDFGSYSLGPHPDVVYDAERDIYLMLYLIPNGSNAGQLGTYIANAPAGPWTAHPLNPIFQAQGGWEGSQLYRAALVQVDGQWYMYYSGNPGSNGMIGLAREVPGVRRVEVSTNGGSSWQQATVAPDGTWTFDWTPPSGGAYTIQARVSDDFLEGDPTPGSDVVVGPGALPPPEDPILIVTDSGYTANPFSTYLAEILRGEGLVEFQQAELVALMADSDPLAYLDSFEMVLLAETDLDVAEEMLLRDYVSSGGNLIAMRPDPDLADLFGLAFVGSRPEQLLQFFAVDTTSEPGAGIVNMSLQYHGGADNYTLNGAVALANLWDDIDSPSTSPAVAINAYGSGQAVAFTFDPAKSIVLTRQGNPAWKDTEGDGLGGYRPGDLFFRSNGDKWLAPERTRIPQADEAQRFLANLILTLSGQPLPRMWYLPDGHKALMVNTGDGEGMSGSTLEPVMNDAASYGGYFTSFLMESGISGTSVAQEAAWRAAGHGVSVHVYGGGPDTYAALYPAYQHIVNSLQTKFGHGARTARSHTIDWTGWADMAAIEAEFGTGLDTNYYHYLPQLLPYGDNANGYFTGSGLPQRFSDENGNVLSIYQALTEWPDEWFDNNGFTADQTAQIIQDMFTAAENGYYSAFVANIHHVRYNNVSGDITHDWANQVWAYARDNGIPMWSAEMLLDFVEARDGAHFDNIHWDGATLAFDFSTPVGGQDLTLMVPAQAAGGNLQSIQVNGSPTTYVVETIKGRDYALFTLTATSAQIFANYAQDTTAPVISNIQVQDIADTAATISWATDELATSRVDYGTDPGNLYLSATVPGYTIDHSVALTSLTPHTPYYYQITSDDRAGNRAISGILSFATGLPRWIETTVADFEDGTLTGVLVTPDGDGAFQLAPATAFFDHFFGSGLSSTDWLSRNIAGRPISVTVADSWVTVADATYIRTNQTFFQQTLEGWVNLADGSNAHFGFATTIQGGDDGITDPHWMIFSVRNGQVLARTRLNDGQGTGDEVNIVLPGVAPGVPHHFKIVWNADNTIEFWVDGSLAATHTRAFTEAMRVYLSSNSGQTGRADWVRVTGEYVSDGAYESSVFDSGGESDFDALSWTGTTPAGTGVAFQTRSSADGIGWSAWESPSPDGIVASPGGRYLQYRATLTTGDPLVTPVVEEVIVTYEPGPDTMPPIVASTDPADQATDVPVNTNITITYNEPINPATFNASIGGGVAFATSFQNGGRTVVLDPDADLDYLTTYNVTIAAGVEDMAGNPTAAPHSFDFTTAELLSGWVETTVADFSDGTLSDTQVTSTGDGEITLAQNFFDHFPGAAVDPTRWTAGDWSGGSVTVSVADSVVTVSDLDYLKSVSTFSESVVEGWVRYGANGGYLNFGVGDNLNAPCTFMVIGPASAGQMRVQTHDSHNDGGGLIIETNQTTNLPAYNSIIGDGQFHYVKVEWTATQVRYYIDNPDIPAAVHTGFGRPLNGNYNIWLSSAGQPLAADWIGVAEYAGSGSYESNVFDAGASNAFRTLTWIGNQPTGTTVSFETRTSRDGSAWSAWQAVDGSGHIVSPVGQYVQYRVTLATSGPMATPVIEQVAISYTPGQDTTPPNVLTTAPSGHATDVPVNTDVTINYDEPINPATFDASISGGVTFNASFENDNRTVVLDPDADLDYFTTYTVTIAAGVEDAAGNPTADPYSFDFTTAEHLLGWVETTVADFEDGTLTDVLVTPDGDGAFQLAPTVVLFDHFPGTALSHTDWLSRNIAGRPISVTVADSWVTAADATYVRTNQTFFQQTLEGWVNLADGSNAHFGFATTVQGGDDGIADPHWMILSARNGQVLARTRLNDGQGTGGEVNTVLPGVAPGVPHLFKIVWNTDNTIEFWVDGSLAATHTRAFTEAMRVYLSSNSGQTGRADWMRVTGEYVSNGAYESSVFDSGGESDLRTLDWVGDQPAGTMVSFATRTSDDGLNWSSWEPVADTAIASPNGRYIQYQTLLSTADPALTPVVQQVAVEYVLIAPDTDLPTVVAATPTGVDVPVDTNVVVNFNEAIDETTFAATVNGVPVPPGEVSFTRIGVQSIATIDLAADLDYDTLYTVVIAGTVEDLAGNSLGTPYRWNFVTVPRREGWIQTTVADFESGTLDGLVVGEDGNGQVRLLPVLYDRFLGTSLGPQWTSGRWSGGAYSPIVADGVMTHTNPGGGAYVRSVRTFQPGTTVEARLRFSRGGNPTAPYLYFGLAGNGLVPWALFGTGYTGDQLYTSVYPGYGPITFGLGNLFDEWHDYKIVWNASSVEFWVDGVLRHTENVAPAGPLNAYFSTSGGTPTSASVAADWVRVEEYGTMAEMWVERLNDTFPEANGPAINWISWGNLTSPGNWSVINHEFVHDPAGTSYHPAILNNTFPPYSNFILETRAMSPNTPGFFGLVWGAQDNAHYYFAQFYPGMGLRVYRVVGWFNATRLADVPSAPAPVPGQWFTMRLEARNGTYRIYVNGTLYATVTDSTYPSGRVGLMGYGGVTSRYDDVLLQEWQTTGVYTSIAFDASTQTEWLALDWTGQQPADTDTVFETRTSINGSDWSDWEAIDSSGDIVSPDGQYIQYRTMLTTADPQASPVVEEVVVTYVAVPRADLELVKHVDDDNPNVGDDVTFTIELANEGPNTATGVEVEDILPDGLTYVSDDSGGAYDPVTGIWDVGYLANGATVTLMITATVDDPGTFTNVAQVRAVDQSDPDSVPDNDDESEDDQDSASLITQAADLSLTKRVNNDNVHVGDGVTFTIAITNDGPDAASGVSVEDVLPGGLRYVSSDSGGTYNPVTGIWDVGNLADGTAVTLVITAAVDEAGTFTNTAQVHAADQFDPDSTPDNGVAAEDDQDSVVLHAEPAADISMTKTGQPDPVVVNNPLTYTILVANGGPSDATHVVLSDILPAEVTLGSAMPSQGNCSGTSTVICNLGNLPDGTTATVTIVVTPTTPGRIANTASVTGDEFDPDTTNNTAIASVGVVNPAIAIAKTPDSQTVPSGSDAAFTIAVTNTGDVPLSNVRVTDASAPDCDRLLADLAVGANASYTCTAARVMADFTNRATVTGIAALVDFEVDDTDIAFVDVLPTIAVTKTADPTNLPEPGGAVTFTVQVTNTSEEAITLNSLEDNVHGDLAGEGTCSLPQTIPAGAPYECAFSATVSGNAGHTETDTVTASGSDDDGNPVEVSASATVTVTDVPSAIAVTKTANPTEVSEPGGTVTFTVRVDNTSAADSVIITTLTDSIHGNLAGQGTCATPQTIPADGHYECTFSATVSGNAGYTETDTVTASGTDDDGNPVSASGDATVTVTDVPSTIAVTKTAAPSVVRAGDTVHFTIRVDNLSVEPVTLVGLDDTVFGDLAAECGLPVSITVGSCFECVISRTIETDHANTVTATAEDDDGNEATDSADASVHVVGPAIQVVKQASASTARVGETITYTYSVENVGDVTLTGVNASDDRLGAIALGRTTLEPGEVTTGTATYLVVESDLPGPLTNTVTVTATPPVGNVVTDTDIVAVSIKPKGSTIYLPIVLNRSVSAPDLVVERITVTGQQVQVVIKNQGNAPVSQDGAFWVDLYVDPNPVPTGVNQTWSPLCSQGIVWGVTAAALPLEPGRMITLTISDAYYWPEHSNFSGPLPAGTPIYVQVDSANVDTTYGAVLEGHEIVGGPYNNISGPVFSVLSTMSEEPVAGSSAPSNLPPASSHRLPPRP